MDLLCEKYREIMSGDDVSCRHPKEYCKYRTACLIQYQSLAVPFSQKKKAGPDNEPGKVVADERDWDGN